MLESFVLSLFAAAAVLFLIFKLGNLRKVLAFDVWIDIITTFTLGAIFFGTFSGMVVAVMGGTIVSIVLYTLKRTIGYDKLTWRGWKPGPRPMDGVMR